MARKKAEQVLPLTPASTLVNLLNLHRRTIGKVGELNDEVGQAISGAVQNKHLHRGAFNIVKRLYLMQDEKLAELKFHLDAYFDQSGIDARVEKVGRLPLNDDNVVDLKADAAE